MAIRTIKQERKLNYNVCKIFIIAGEKKTTNIQNIQNTGKGTPFIKLKTNIIMLHLNKSRRLQNHIPENILCFSYTNIENTRTHIFHMYFLFPFSIVWME